MPYRIHFTAQDLARTRLADGPLPLCELRVATGALRSRSLPVRLQPWRRSVRERLPATVVTALSRLPPDLWSPGIVAIPPASPAEEIIERIRATPRTTLRAEMALLAERHTIPRWLRGLPDDPDLLQRQCDGLDLLYATLLQPFWAQLVGLHLADRTVRMRHVLSGGVERLLAQANPRWIRWRAPTLEVDTPDGTDHDLVLEGQGVLLAPSAFRTRPWFEPATVPQPILSYPASFDRPLHRLTTFTPPASEPHSAVVALLGRTRSAVLTVIAEHPGCTTKELAAFAGIAPASASEHATVLREAGLIRTARHRNAVLHSPTDLGVNLLDAPA